MLAPMQRPSPPRTPPSDNVAREYQQTQTPSDESSIMEELSFDYEEDSAGNFVRVSKGGSSNRSNHSSPPTPQDPSPLSARTYGQDASPLSTVTTAKHSAPPVLLNSPAAERRTSLSRSESYPVVTAVEQRAPPSAAARSFQRVASGPSLSSTAMAPSLRAGSSNGARRVVTQRPGISLEHHRESDDEARPDWGGEEKESITDTESAGEYGGHNHALLNPNKKRPSGLSPRLGARSASTSQIERITSALPSRSSSASSHHLPPPSVIPSSASSSRALARQRFLKGVKYSSAAAGGAARMGSASSLGFDRISEIENGDGDAPGATSDYYVGEETETGAFISAIGLFFC